MFEAPWCDGHDRKAMSLFKFPETCEELLWKMAVAETVVGFLETILAMGDDRVVDWPMMDPMHMVVPLVAYLVGLPVLVWVMKQKARSNGGVSVVSDSVIKPIVFLHNLALVSLSAYMVFEIVRQAMINKYTIFGNEVDKSNQGLGMARILWIFYVSKIAEFTDTVFMALRCRFRQISFLHVYHHSTIYVVWWLIVYLCPGGDAYFTALLNSSVHVFMYGYYLWSAIVGKPKKSKDPSAKPISIVWTTPGFWRPYITSFQILQFCLMLVQASFSIIFNSSLTSFPLPFCVFMWCYELSLLALFVTFYKNNYNKKKEKSLNKPHAA